LHAVAPGFIETAMTEVLGEGIQAERAKQSRSAAVGSAADGGQCAAFLASDEAPTLPATC